jgi:cytochrome c553
MRRSLLAIVLSVGLTPAFVRAAEPAPTAEQLRFFESRVRPVLVDQCLRCHGAQKQKAGLRLDSREHLLRGSSGGPVIIAGKPEQSPFIKAITHADADLKMPPDKKLSDAQIADLTQWVKMGAPYPASAAAAPDDREKVRRAWAFQPPAEVSVPAVKDTAWSQSPLDRFILAALEAKGLRPAPAADKRTLLRRVTFDLIGLPPTPEEIDAFLADNSPEALARVVDRLLASPHYGERWGRHWLDVARYADSNGLDENVAFGTAWRYRDYVIAAFNADRPYDQFVIEQLAGDLLESPNPQVRHERLIATGFLALGAKVLAEVDERKMEMDIIDEQIDTVGRTFLGLTLGCARCHDHKFDPISTEDYYGLAGIFKSTRTMEHFKKIARWYENSIATPEEKARVEAHQGRIAQTQSMIDGLLRKGREQLVASGKTVAAKPDEGQFTEDIRADLKKLRFELAALKKSAPELPSALGVNEGKPVDVPVHLRGEHLKLGKMVARRVPEVLAGSAAPRFDGQHSGRLELARWLVRGDHPLTSRVMVNRLWRWHFGQGLVRTPDNFGRLGDAPDNAPLLDWLARRFVQERWSIKAMHRTIILSSTYQMSTRHPDGVPNSDPDNRLQWRANVHRLEAEAVRDSLLAISGRLDRTMGGSLLKVPNRQHVFDHTSMDGTSYDTTRRSLYLPLIRNNLYDVFPLFDATDATVPSGDRATTTVAPQALFLMNSEFVSRACRSLAERLLREKTDNDARVRRLYAIAFGRAPAEREVARARKLLADFDKVLTAKEPAERQREAWAYLCQTLVAANEFIYIR